MRGLRCIVPVLLVVATIFVGRDASAAPSGVLVGDLVGEAELHITYTSTAPIANNVVYREARDDAGLTAYNDCRDPNACKFYSLQGTALLADTSQDLANAAGACRLVARGVGECAQPGIGLHEHHGFFYHEPTVVSINVGAGNDTVGVVNGNTPTFQDFARRISVDAGVGNDTVVLVDQTIYGSDHQDSYGLDRVDCGPGIDRAIVGPSVMSTFGCESVTRLPA